MVRKSWCGAHHDGGAGLLVVPDAAQVQREVRLDGVSALALLAAVLLVLVQLVLMHAALLLGRAARSVGVGALARGRSSGPWVPSVLLLLLVVHLLLHEVLRHVSLHAVAAVVVVRHAPAVGVAVTALLLLHELHLLVLGVAAPASSSSRIPDHPAA